MAGPVYLRTRGIHPIKGRALTVMALTGSRWGDRYRAFIVDRLRALPLADEYVTGACMGVDAIAGLHLYLIHPPPAVAHRVIVPANRRHVDPWWVGHLGARLVDVEHMPSDTTYKDRNARLVELADYLVAFPEYPERHRKSLRSGTWQTVRMAQRKGIPVTVYVLNDPGRLRAA